MKFHFCFLNWSKWSGAVNGYGGQIQVRTCIVCESISTRDIGYAKQVKANELNIASTESMGKGAAL